MKKHIRAITGALALVLVLAGTAVNALPQLAVAASYTGVYLLDYPDGPGSIASTADPVLTGSNLGGVAIWRDYVFVADGSGGTGRLHIGQIDTTGLTPKINWTSTVNIGTVAGGVNNPSAVAVDESGGVYIISGSRSGGADATHSYAAYLPSAGKTWAAAGLNTLDMPTAFFADIDTIGSSGAIIAHQDARDATKHWAGESWVSAISGANVNATNPTGDHGYEPRGIAAGNNGLSYVVNHSTDKGNGAEAWGSISVISNATAQSAVNPAIETGNFRPTDVSYFSVNGINYLGIVGTTVGGTDQAWRVQLDANGLPLVAVNGSGELSGGSVLTKTLGNSTDVFCTASPDGHLFWITNPGTGVVTAINTTTWMGMEVNTTGAPRYIAAYTAAVPEPASLVVLLTGSAGVFGVIRRRRRRQA